MAPATSRAPPRLRALAGRLGLPTSHDEHEVVNHFWDELESTLDVERLLRKYGPQLWADGELSRSHLSRDCSIQWPRDQNEITAIVLHYHHNDPSQIIASSGSEPPRLQSHSSPGNRRELQNTEDQCGLSLRHQATQPGPRSQESDDESRGTTAAQARNDDFLLDAEHQRAQSRAMDEQPQTSIRTKITNHALDLVANDGSSVPTPYQAGIHNGSPSRASTSIPGENTDSPSQSGADICRVFLQDGTRITFPNASQISEFIQDINGVATEDKEARYLIKLTCCSVDPTDIHTLTFPLPDDQLAETQADIDAAFEEWRKKSAGEPFIIVGGVEKVSDHVL